MKLLDNKGKYLTKIDDTVKVKSKLDDQIQTFKYTAQGDIIAGEECLVNNNNNLLLTECNDKSSIWTIDDGLIKTKSQPMCLTSDSNDNVSLKTCMPSKEDQEWDIENESSTSSYAWNSYKGKKVVLVEADNPWYVNKEITTRLKIIPPEPLQDLQYKNGDVKHNIIIEKKGIDCCEKFRKPKKRNIENFGNGKNNETNNKNVNQILFYLCFILLLLFIYRYYRKRKYM